MNLPYFYRSKLTLHDNVFFASREMGTLYETEKYFHNWALTYALFEITHIPKPYRMQGKLAQKPVYLNRDREQNLVQLNDIGIYVFPALPITWSYQINTFKAAQVAYYGKSKQFGAKGANRNYPINYGRAKELTVGSTYRTYIISKYKITIPQWIRLGKWSSKIKVEVEPIEASNIKPKFGTFVCQHPLNPIDLPSSIKLLLYNRIVMPPSSLVSQSQLEGDFWEVSDIKLPRGTRYGQSILSPVNR